MPAKWHSLTILCASAAALIERTSSSGVVGTGGDGAFWLGFRHRLIHRIPHEIHELMTETAFLPRILFFSRPDGELPLYKRK